MVVPFQVQPATKIISLEAITEYFHSNCQCFDYESCSDVHFLQLIDGLKENRSSALSADELHPSGEQEYQEPVEQHHTGVGKKRKKPSSSPAHSNQSMDEIIQVELDILFITHMIHFTSI